MSNLPLRLRRTIARDGISAAARRLLQRIWRRCVYAHDHVVVFRHRAGEAFPTPDDMLRRAEFEVRDMDMVSARAAADSYPDVLTPAVLQLFDDSLRAGERGVMVLHDGILGHYSWMGTREAITASEAGSACVIRLSRPAALIYHCWTAPAARGLGIYTFVLRRLCRLAEAAGLDCWIYCEPRNTASIAGIRKAGFRPSHHFHRRRWFGLFSFHSVRPA